MNKRIAAILLFMIFSFSVFAQQNSGKKEINMGISTDLLPYISAALTGEEGLSFQGWISINQFKYRIVAAHTAIPESFTYNGIKSQELNAFALIIDYYFREQNKGLWIGTGIELWENHALDEISEKSISWSSLIITIGGGYTFTLGEHLYLNPFAALHFNPAPESVRTETSSFKEKNILSSASVKIGWMF